MYIYLSIYNIFCQVKQVNVSICYYTFIWHIGENISIMKNICNFAVCWEKRMIPKQVHKLLKYCLEPFSLDKRIGLWKLYRKHGLLKQILRILFR